MNLISRIRAIFTRPDPEVLVRRTSRGDDGSYQWQLPSDYLIPISKVRRGDLFQWNDVWYRALSGGWDALEAKHRVHERGLAMQAQNIVSCPACYPGLRLPGSPYPEIPENRISMRGCSICMETGLVDNRINPDMSFWSKDGVTIPLMPLVRERLPEIVGDPLAELCAGAVS